jgi:hypothetical protein
MSVFGPKPIKRMSDFRVRPGSEADRQKTPD